MTMHQLPLPIHVDPARSFDSFLPGGNALAWEQLKMLARQHPGEAGSPPLYLWGPPGTGKTHLLQALAARERDQGLAVAWFDPTAPAPWDGGPPAAVIVFDHCDRLDVAQQQAAFALFVDASSRGALVAAAGRLPPVDLPLRDDLRSRLGWGHVIALHPLGEEELRAVLIAEADRRGLGLGREAVAYLLRHCPRDLASLTALLDRADAYTLSRRRGDLTVPMIRHLLDETAAAAASPAHPPIA